VSSPDLTVDGIDITIPDDLVVISDYEGSLSNFTCGSEPLDEFIREQAREYSQRHLGETWLLCSEGHLLAFYTLVPASVPNEDYTGNEAEEMSNLDDFGYPVPALHLARIGVANEYRGNGIGKELVDYIIVWAENQDLPFWLIELVSKEESIEFYKRLNFVTSGEEDDENGHTTMFYPLAPRIN
jgi:ribosomal protein S18 acetylase RimI-like enzyme